jgi:alpha-L-fucosidase
MFIHWGPYSQFAGEWNGQRVPTGRGAEWIMKILHIPVSEYKELAHKMNPEKFNARDYVRLAKSTGMKYLVVTAKHHDGFAMYHSKVSDYNIVDWTSFKRDPIRELAEECAKEGIRFGVYYSHREDWEHPGGYGNDWDYDNDWGSYLFEPDKFNRYLEEKARPQLKELLTNYGSIGLVWFDRGMFTREQGLEFVRLVNEIQPSTLVNGRVGNYEMEFIGDYQSTGDNGMPPGGLDEYWETPQTLNTTWGYSKYDTNWKSPEEVTRRLAEVVSKGGNYLLNIGPKGDGEIPDTTITIFNKVGHWMEQNSESIYGTSANPFGTLEWGYCTVKGSRLYLFVRDWPQNNRLSVPNLKNNVKTACMLADQSLKLEVNKGKNETIISLPSRAPNSLLPVVAVDIEGSIQVEPQRMLPDSDGCIKLDYLTVATYGNAMTRFNRKGGFHISKWTGPGDTAEWSVRINKPGRFKVSIEYAANSGWEGKSYIVTIGRYSLEKKVICTGGLFEFHKLPLGYIDLPEPGDYQITISPKEQNDTYLMYLHSIFLEQAEKIKYEGWVN